MPRSHCMLSANNARIKFYIHWIKNINQRQLQSHKFFYRNNDLINECMSQTSVGASVDVSSTTNGRRRKTIIFDAYALNFYRKKLHSPAPKTTTSSYMRSFTWRQRNQMFRSFFRRCKARVRQGAREKLCYTSL